MISLTYLEAFGAGLSRPLRFASHIVLAILLPILVITATKSGLKQNTVTSFSYYKTYNFISLFNLTRKTITKIENFWSNVVSLGEEEIEGELIDRVNEWMKEGMELMNGKVKEWKKEWSEWMEKWRSERRNGVNEWRSEGVKEGMEWMNGVVKQVKEGMEWINEKVKKGMKECTSERRNKSKWTKEATDWMKERMNKLYSRPLVEVEGAHPRDVCAQVAMHARALNTH